jgi:rubrerythrin
MTDSLAVLRNAVEQYEFALKVRRALNSVRLIDESDEQTFARVMRLAQKVICPDCRGYGHTPGSSKTCPTCNYTGERHIMPSDPTRP